MSNTNKAEEIPMKNKTIDYSYGYIDGQKSRQIEIDSLTNEVERLREGLIMAKNYASNTNVIDAIDKVLTTSNH